ncbi:CmcI family methyltransferase [soil metagenome]
MKFIIDTDEQTITYHSTANVIPLYSTEGFEAVSKLWLQVGWNQKHVYTFSWMGRPVIQLPEDMIRAQEAIFQVRPDVIIETGIAHGGSLIFNAGLYKTMGIDGRVIGVDIEIRPHNRKAIEEHFLFPYITMIEGGSTDPLIVSQVRDLVGPDDRVMVFLDSDHSRDHVLAELEAYAGFVTPGSYIVATDGIMGVVADVPRAGENWRENNPVTAVHKFLESHPEFELIEPAWLFNESELIRNINTHWNEAWLRRR